MRRGAALAILPSRDGDPLARLEDVPAAAESGEEILRRAEALGIPWKRVLLGEIDAEQRLRRYLADVEGECPLPSAVTILSFCALQSWRVRDCLQSLAAQSRGDPSGAPRQLRAALRRFAGRGDGDRAALAEHLWFAYQRILLLQRVCRAAARSRGATAERVASVCTAARCCFEDASWAVRHEDSPERARRLEAAVGRVREEGFLVPRAPSEAKSLAELRRIVHASPRRKARGLERNPSYPVSAPRRLQPSDAV